MSTQLLVDIAAAIALLIGVVWIFACICVVAFVIHDTFFRRCDLDVARERWEAATVKASRPYGCGVQAEPLARRRGEHA